MKRMLFTAAAPLAATLLFSTYACKKNNASPVQSQKYQIVSGNWQETDIQLDVAATVKIGSTKYSFPVGTSMITNPTLKALGVTTLFTPTINNTYHFSDSGAYSIAGVTKVILPVAGSTGKWSLDEYDAVLKLNPSDTVNDPHWISSISDTSMSLLMTVTIPGLGAAPLTLQLKKQ
jgi:hypothetical protein